MTQLTKYDTADPAAPKFVMLLHLLEGILIKKIIHWQIILNNIHNQCCGTGAGAARNHIIWTEPEP
jgi:hypothetical protein